MNSLPSESTVAQSGSSAIERGATADSSHQPTSPHDPGQPIDLLGFFKGLGRHWLAGLITLIVTAGLLVGYSLLMAPKNIVNTAVKYLHDGTTADDLKASASLYWGGGGTVIAVYSMGTNQEQATERANAYARAFTEKANDLVPTSLDGLPQPKLTIVQQAFPSDPNPHAPVTTTSSNKLLSPAVGVLVGLVLGLVVMGVLEYRSSRRSMASH